MGLRDLFRINRAPSTSYINLDSSLGNVLVSGNSRYGKTRIIRNYSINSWNNGGALVVIRNAGSDFSTNPDITDRSQAVWEIDTGDGAFTEQFNPFADLNEQQMVELIFTLFNKYMEFEASNKMKFKQYISKMLGLIRREGKSFRLNELCNYTLEKIEQMNQRSRLPDSEKLMNERFFDNIRPDVCILESYFYDFGQNNIGFIMSGNKALEDIAASGKMIEFSIDFSTRKEEADLLLTILIDKLYKFDCDKANCGDVTVIFDDLPNDSLIKSGADKLLRTPGNRLRVLYSIMDIALLSDKSNVFVDGADSLFFFQQQSNKNQEYCSQFFGTYEKQKVSITNTTGSSTGKNSSYNWVFGEAPNSYSRGRQSSRNTSHGETITTEKERIYLPDVFKALPEHQCIYFFRSDNSHNYLTLS